MHNLRLLKNGTILLVFALCFVHKSSRVEAFYIPSRSPVPYNAEDTFTVSPHYEIDRRMETETGSTASRGNDDEVVMMIDSDEVKSERTVNVSQRSMADNFRDFFSPFLGFPIYPFHLPGSRGGLFDFDFTEKPSRVEKDASAAGNRSDHKPFLFIDFAFNIREVPSRNLTGDAPVIHPNATGGNSEGPPSSGRRFDKDLAIDILDDDLSFFDESPLMSPETDEFLPKSDFLFFDFPFHRKQSKKLVRNKRDMKKPEGKGTINYIMQMLNEAISRTKREMERTVPLWTLFNNPEKGSEEEMDGEGFPDKFHGRNDRKLQLRDAQKSRSGRMGVKGVGSSHGSGHHKNPVILEKVVEIGEIHFGNDFAKNKRKRRNGSVSGKKGGSHGMRENVELVQMGEPLKSDLAPKHFELPSLHTSIKDIFHRIHNQKVQDKEHKEDGDSSPVKAAGRTGDARILEFLGNWDGREVEEQLKMVTAKDENFNTFSKKDSSMDEGHPRFFHEVSRSKQMEGFKRVGHKPSGRAVEKEDVGFEVLKPHGSFAMSKRGHGEGGVIDEYDTELKDKVKRNITEVLGQFFSVMKKLGEFKSLYQDKENSDMEHVNWPEVPEISGSSSCVKDDGNGVRRTRNTHPEEKSQVADLNYLFLTVTLPTMIAFTLLLVICFFNLRVRGWLCTKLFKPRHVYVVEADVEKGKREPTIFEFQAASCGRPYKPDETEKKLIHDKPPFGRADT